MAAFRINLLDFTLYDFSESSGCVRCCSVSFLKIQNDFARIAVDAFDDTVDKLTQEEVLAGEASLLQTGERDPPGQFTVERDEYTAFLDERHSPLHASLLGQLI